MHDSSVKEGWAPEISSRARVNDDWRRYEKTKKEVADGRKHAGRISTTASSNQDLETDNEKGDCLLHVASTVHTLPGVLTPTNSWTYRQE